MPRERLRPFSRQHWEERRRQYRLQSTSSVWLFGWAGIVLLVVFVGALVVTAYHIIPRDMRDAPGARFDDAVSSMEEKMERIEEKIEDKANR